MRRGARRVLLAGFMGGTVEYYDFLLYGTAASLVFGRVFFVTLPEPVALFASFATLAVGYVARPLGGVICGHFGDRYGRKNVLIGTMMVMGIASTVIGVLPPHSVIGVTAPVALICMRFIQGLALGGEWGGATVMAIEYSQVERRGLFAGVVNSGAPAGALLATLTMGTFSLLPEQDFLTWGWRIPFLLSLVLIGIALWVRLGIRETPAFIHSQATEASNPHTPTSWRAWPLISVLRRPRTLLVTTLAAIAGFGFQSLLATWALSYAILHGTPRATVLFAASVGSALNILAVPLFGAVSDVLGRKRALVGATIVAALLTVPMLALIGSGESLLVILGYVMGYGIIVGSLTGPLGAFIGEQFTTRSRYTGTSLGYQLSATLGAGFTPMIVSHLYTTGTSTMPVIGYLLLLLLSTCLAVLVGKGSVAQDKLT